jgi:hypothetical protein
MMDLFRSIKKTINESKPRLKPKSYKDIHNSAVGELGQEQQRERMIKLLKKNGTTVNDLQTILNAHPSVVGIKDARRGRTPLHHAVELKVKPEIVKKLLEQKSADIHAINKESKSVFHDIAKYNPDMKILSLFATKAAGEAKSCPIEINVKDFLKRLPGSAQAMHMKGLIQLREDKKIIEKMMNDDAFKEYKPILERMHKKMTNLIQKNRFEYPDLIDTKKTSAGGKRKTQKRRRSLSSNTLKRKKKQKAKLKKKNKSIGSYRSSTKTKTYKKK